MASDVHNGTAADQMTCVDWRTSSYSGKEGDCVQGRITRRHSRSRLTRSP